MCVSVRRSWLERLATHLDGAHSMATAQAPESHALAKHAVNLSHGVSQPNTEGPPVQAAHPHSPEGSSQQIGTHPSFPAWFSACTRSPMQVEGTTARPRLTIMRARMHMNGA